MEKEELKSYIREIESNNPSLGACRRLSNMIHSALQDEFSIVELHQGHIVGEQGTREHFYLTVGLVEGQTVIVDPTIDQFTKENWRAHKVETYIPEEEIPSIGYISPNMEVYGRYQ